MLILREKFSPGPGFEPGFPALRLGIKVKDTSADQEGSGKLRREEF